MMLNGDLSGVFDLIQIQLEQFAQRGCRHGAGASHLRLASALTAGDGRIGLDQIAHDAAGSQGAHDLLVGKSPLLLLIVQHRRHHAGRAAGGRCDDALAGGVLLADHKGKGAHHPVLPGFSALVDVLSIHELFRLALNLQAPG